MKKIAFMLAMLLCLVPVLSACGANSSPEKAAKAAFEARYVDYDYEAYYEVAYQYNLDLIDEIMEGSDKLDSMKETARSSRDSIKETIKSAAKAAESDEIDSYDIDYEVRYSISYDKDSDMFDSVMANFEFADTDFEDLVEEVAIVGIVTEVYVTDTDDNEYITGDYETYYCYNIDGDWYVD